MNSIEITGLLLAAGEAATLFIIIAFMADFSCADWLGWAISCPPSALALIVIITPVYILFIYLFWFVIHRKQTN
jgi:hypothetical protein